MGVRQFRIKYSDLVIEKSQITKVLKFGDSEIPPHFDEMINDQLKAASSLCEIQGGYRIIDSISVTKSAKKISLGHTELLVGKNIAVYLQKAEKLAILLCTAGPGIESRSQFLMKGGHYPEGFIMDIIGSLVVDSAMDFIHEALEKDMQSLGLQVSNRYSPGYCTWDVSEQQKLFSLFPGHFAGITLSESSLMNPIKSVSAIAGISKGIKRLAYMCDTCTMTDCTFRNLKL